MNHWRSHFPIFSHQPELVYLDSAATTQKPAVVIEAIRQHYETGNANVHRGLYPLAEAATAAYEQARQRVADFISAPDYREVIFTRNATEAINLLAWSLGQNWGPEQNIVLWEGEHHANLVPWQQLRQRQGTQLRFVRSTSGGEIDLEHLRTQIDAQTVLVTLTHCSNVLGKFTQAGDVRVILAEQGSTALFLLDACQSLPHIPVFVKELGCDFLVASGHKLYGPSGIGFLWGRGELLEALPPYQTGGEMIRTVSQAGATWNTLPWKFEAGTPNIEGAIGLGAAVHFLSGIGMEQVANHVADLSTQLHENLAAIPGVHILGTPDPQSGIIAFSVVGLHPHDLADLLGQQGICIRAGQHCAAPLHTSLNLVASNRVSLGLYSNEEDATRFLQALQEIITEVHHA